MDGSSRIPTLAIIRGLMSRREEGRKFRHSPPADSTGGPAYVEIREDVAHHREIETELHSLGYEYQWQRKR